MSYKDVILNKRIKNKKLTDVSVIVKSIDEFDDKLKLEVIWMNDLNEFEIGSDTLYIKPETLNEWYIYEPIKQASEQRNGI